MKVSGIEVVAQFCVDPEKSKAWYTDFLGAETTQYPSPLFVLGGSTLLLAPGTPGTGRGGTGVYFHVASVDEAYKELTARGYKFNEQSLTGFLLHVLHVPQESVDEVLHTGSLRLSPEQIERWRA